MWRQLYEPIRQKTGVVLFTWNKFVCCVCMCCVCVVCYVQTAIAHCVYKIKARLNNKYNYYCFNLSKVFKLYIVNN